MRGELADASRIPVWLIERPLYSFAPFAWSLRRAAVQGRLDWQRYRERDVLLRLLRRHLGDDDVNEVAARHFEYRRKVDAVRLWPQVRNFAGADRIPVEGLHHLDGALARGRGAVLVTAHFGYTRVLKPLLGVNGRRALLVGHFRRPGAPDLRPHLTPLGGYVHTRLLGLPRASRFDPRWNATVGEDLPAALNVRPHLAALARNDALIILADGRVSRHLRPVRLLDMDVPLAAGAFMLARSAGAAALPTFLVDEPGCSRPESFRLVIRPPLELRAAGDRHADLHACLQQFAAAYEPVIRRYPHNFHWTWVRDGAFTEPA